MKLSAILTTTALAYRASARWVAWTPDPVMDLTGGDLARPTQPSEVEDYQVWAPEPTQPPSKAIVDLLLHRRTKTESSSANNTWENDHTCGWYPGVESKAYVCDGPLSCSTKDDVVACATDGLEGFYTVCLNYDAVKSGKCSSVGVQTGCCQDKAQPECGTLVWPGATAKSMFKCFASETMISMNDRPQYIIDSSSSAASASSASSVSSASAAAASSSSAAEAASRSGNGPSTVTATTTAADGSTSVYTTVMQGDTSVSATAGSGAGSGNGGDSGGSSTNTGATVGGIIGGLSLLALIIAFLVWYIMRKKNKKFTLSLCGGKKKTNKEKHIHNQTYNEKNVTKNDKRAYDKRSYEDTSAYDQRSRSVTPNQTHNQNFHFHIEDDRYDTTPEPRPSGSRTPPPPVQPLPSILVTAPSKREQRRQARQQRLQQQPQQEPERDLETEEMEQAREQQDHQTHRYHPSSGQRYHDARRTPSPPLVSQPPAPSLDFIGRGI